MAGWVVGKFDFNENPVLSLDLGLEFGLRFRVCQKDFCFDRANTNSSYYQQLIGLNFEINLAHTKLLFTYIS